MPATRILAFGLASGLALLGAAGSAWSHGDWQPKHGGQLNDGETTFELVVRGRSVTIYLEDHGTPISTKAARGELTITRGDLSVVRALEPAGENRMRAVDPASLARGDRVLARVTLSNGSIVAGRFVYAP